MYIGISDISNKSEVRRDHIPILIKAGVGICMGVMKSENNSGFIDKFKRLIINAEIVLREISYCNNKLGDQKFTAFQLFGHFSDNFRDELVKAGFLANFTFAFASALALSFTFALEILSARYNKRIFTTLNAQNIYERTRQPTDNEAQNLHERMRQHTVDFMHSEVQKINRIHKCA